MAILAVCVLYFVAMQITRHRHDEETRKA